MRDSFYSKVLGLTSDRFKRHWIAMVFSGEATTAPREIGSATELVQFVALRQGAIAFVSHALLDSTVNTVKVITIDGLHPRDAGYPIK